MNFKKHNRKLGLMLSFFLFISTILSVFVIPLPIAKAAPTYSWSTFTVAASGDDVELLAENGWSNYTTDEDNLWVHSNEYTTYAYLRFEGLGAITNAGGIIDQIILGMYSGVDVGADYEEGPYEGGYVSVSCPLTSWNWELTEENILIRNMNPVASFDGDDLSPSGAWYNKTISNSDPRDWYSWGIDFNDVFICSLTGFMQYSPDWTYYRSFTSFDEGHPAKLYVKYHIGTGYQNVLDEFGVDWASYAGSWNNYNLWHITSETGPVEYTWCSYPTDTFYFSYDKISGTGPYTVDTITQAGDAGYNNQRKIVRTKDDELYVVYAIANRVWAAKSIDEGATWIDKIRISPNQASYYPSIAIDSNDVPHVVYADLFEEAIYYLNYTDSWSTPLAISYIGYEVSQPAIAIDGNDYIHVIYTGQNTSYPVAQLWYTNYTGSWSAPLRISTKVDMISYIQKYGSIATDSLNNIHISWMGDNGTGYRIYYIKRTTSWETITQITVYFSEPSSIAIDPDDNPHITWDGQGPGVANEQIWVTYHNGTEWQEHVLISTVAGMVDRNQDNPSITIDPQSIRYIAFQGRPTGVGGPDIYLATYTDSWNTPVKIQDTGLGDYNPTLIYPIREILGGFVATSPNGTVITPDPFEELDDCIDFVEEWDVLYGPACSFNGATLYEADGVTVKTDGWLFMGEVYVVKAEIRNFTTFCLELDDGKNTIYFNYVNATKSLNIDASEFVAGLVQGTVITLNATAEEYELAWKFILNKNILDVPIGQNITYYGVNTPKESYLSGTAITGLMIYNLGGHVTYEFQGDAGRRIGGDALEIHHTNSTGNGAYVDVMFRRMQHVHLAFSLDVEDNDCFDHDENSGIVQFGFKYWDGAEWDDLYYAEMSIVNGAVDPVSGDGKAFIIPYVSWNSRQSDGNMTLVKSDVLSGYPECADDVNSQITYSKFYLDLWFNTMNSSTTVGGRISTKYFGMDESTSWFFWSNWKPVMVNQTESMFFDDLRDEEGDILQISDIELVKFFIRVIKTGSGANGCDTHTWGIVDPEFSKTLAADRMQAINTPDGIDTLVLDMPSTGFLQPIAKAISGIGTMIWQGALNFVKILIASMDTIFVWIGFPAGTFSQISNWVLTIPDFMIALIGYFGDILTNMIIQVTRLFNVLAIGIPQLIYGTGLLVSTITSYLTQIISLFTGGWSGVSDFWSGLALAQWIELFFIAVLPFMWLARIESSSDGFKTAREDIGWVFSLLFVLIDLGSWLIQTIGTILQAIRNILPI